MDRVERKIRAAIASLEKAENACPDRDTEAEEVDYRGRETYSLIEEAIDALLDLLPEE